MDMQARRDAFTLLTDEKAPGFLHRWLVTWTIIDVHGIKWDEWSSHKDEDDAGRWAADRSGKVYDLDNQ